MTNKKLTTFILLLVLKKHFLHLCNNLANYYGHSSLSVNKLEARKKNQK